VKQAQRALGPFDGLRFLLSKATEQSTIELNFVSAKAMLNAHDELVAAVRLAVPILESSARRERIANRVNLARNCTSEHALNATRTALARAEQTEGVKP